ncbi:MAG: OprO/OprP family phosphate-selective porin [Bacteroidaceae bacterium]|nr:OprO/OprP family phosphate-selective porin [Bacteroidaceae bacterium]
MKNYIAAALIATLPLAVSAQNPDGLSDNGIVTINGNRGLQFESKDGAFSFKPYILMQTSLNFHYYDDEGLDKAYNQDNIANSGFSIPYACIGFTGKAWSKVTYNLTLNASASGAKLLQQAWFDVNFSRGLALKVGKFKTPFSHAYLTTLGETLMPSLPTSLTATSIMPYRLNAVTPTIGTGFDLGVELHGMMGKWWSYEAGLFNGTGAGTNSATKTLSDDWHIPSLLYAGRVAWMPMGVMPKTQGNPKLLHENKFMLAGSANLNVEAESESTNDSRYGIEAAWLHNRWYVGGEFYWMHVGFTERQKIDETFNYKGGYIQAGYFCTPQLQVAARYDFLDRNGDNTDGFLNMPAVGCNYFIKDTGLKLSAMYQFIGRTGHENQIDRDNDDLGLAKHSAVVMLQYAF